MIHARDLDQRLVARVEDDRKCGHGRILESHASYTAIPTLLHGRLVPQGILLAAGVARASSAFPGGEYRGSA